jgi:hypothetical protein
VRFSLPKELDMATSQQFLVCDSSTLANFKQWAQAISGFFSTAGWSQATDTGQVNWSTISSVPGSSAFVYEIWKPNDGLTNFFVKMEYGNISGSNCPSLRITISTTTDGAGNPTGLVMGPQQVVSSSFTPPSTTTQFECDFSGAGGRIGAMMWRNGTNNCQQFFAIERSLNSSGSYTSGYVTLWTSGNLGSTGRGCWQGSLVFGVGLAPQVINQPGSGQTSTWVNRVQWVGATTAFNGSIPFDTCAPVVGFIDYPCTVCGAAYGPDIVEGVPFSATLYGATRTYMPSKNASFAQAGAYGSNEQQFAAALCMRYD